MLFDLFKKKPSKDPYLERVASILHSTLAPMLPLPQAYGLAAECLSDLRQQIRKGVLVDGKHPANPSCRFAQAQSLGRQRCGSSSPIRL